MFSIFKKIFGPKADLKHLLAQGAQIIDVRTAAEFKSGHIQGAVNIPLNQVRHKVQELKKKNQVVITYCRSGSRSAIAARILKKSGVEAYNGGPWDALQHRIQ